MEADLNKVLELAASDKVGANADSIMGMLEQVDKIIQHGDKILNFVNKLEKSTLIGTIIKAKMKGAGIDVGPLTAPDIGVIPSTDLHKQIMENINKMTPEQISAMMAVLMEHDKKMETRAIEDKTGKTGTTTTTAKTATTAGDVKKDGAGKIQAKLGNVTD